VLIALKLYSIKVPLYSILQFARNSKHYSFLISIALCVATELLPLVSQFQIHCHKSGCLFVVVLTLALRRLFP